jgi:hypothetical protein
MLVLVLVGRRRVVRRGPRGRTRARRVVGGCLTAVAAAASRVGVTVVLALVAVLPMLATEHASHASHDSTSQSTLLVRLTAGLSTVVVLGCLGLVAVRREQAGRELAHELAGRVLATVTAVSAVTAAAEELTGESAERVRTVAAATTVSGVLATKEGVHCHATKASPISSGAVRTPRSIRHDRFHSAIGMLDRLRTVWVRDELRLGGAVGVFDVLSGRVARLDSMGGNLPLRHACGELDKVVLLARAIPLRNPAGGQIGGSVRGAFGAGGRRPSHDRQKVVLCGRGNWLLV